MKYRSVLSPFVLTPMSAMNSSTGDVPPCIPPAPSADQVAALNGAMDLLLIAAMCTATLIPISVALVLSSSFLMLVVLWATLRAVLLALPKALRPKIAKKTYEWDRHELFQDEVVTGDVSYYAKAVGMHIEVDEITTQDGFILKCVFAVVSRLS